MASLHTLRLRRLQAQLELAKAELRPKKKGRGEARRNYVNATADVLRAEINCHIATPRRRAQAAQRETGDLFSQMGA